MIAAKLWGFGIRDWGFVDHAAAPVHEKQPQSTRS